MQLPTFFHEEQHWNDNCLVFGIDEVGRGCLAGPVHASVACFNPSIAEEVLPLKVNDSKLLSRKAREALIPHIHRLCLHHGTGSATVAEIDQKGIVTAVNIAAVRALKQALKTISGNSTGQKNNPVRHPSPSPLPYRLIFLTDTLAFPGISVFCNRRNIEHTQIAIPKGDTVSITIAAASVLAKVTRDGHMSQLAQQYPDYGWDTNMGYGTKKHRENLQKNGKTPHHRALFIRKILQKEGPNIVINR
ncbi:MAG: ribonuclease HII [Patescibacteria group bacterium]